MISWLTSPVGAAVLTLLGLFVSVVGFAGTIFGLFLTYGQARKTLTAAEAAKTAAKEVRSRVASFDATYELSRASAALVETQRHLRNQNWFNAADSYFEVRGAIVKLDALAPNIEEAERNELRSMLADISVINTRIDKWRDGEKPPINHAIAISKSRVYSETLQRIGIQLLRSNA